MDEHIRKDIHILKLNILGCGIESAVVMGRGQGGEAAPAAVDGGHPVGGGGGGGARRIS
jgi:hypothetical protein